MPDAIDTLWTILATLFVFVMHAGFGFFEAGMCRRKNTVDTLSHNLLILAVTLAVYWAVGFGLMFGDGNLFAGLSGFAPALLPAGAGSFHSLAARTVPIPVAFAFAVAFADTPATLVAGTGAERIKLPAVLMLSVLISGLVFPLVGRAVMGGGWLQTTFPGFHDSGSGMIHLTGGMCAMAVALVLGPRRDRFDGDDRGEAFAPSSMPMVFLGAFVLWAGFLAFNAGFAMHVSPAIALIVINGLLAAAAGALVALLGSWLLTGAAQLRSTVIGLLTASVAITSPSAVVEPWAALVIGALAGLLVVGSIRLIARLRIDDPTEYLTMNVVGGLLGLISVAVFASPEILRAYDTAPKLALGLAGGRLQQLGIALLGAAVMAVFAFIVTALACLALRSLGLLRVDPEEERTGSDLPTHGERAEGGDGDKEEE